eukprot:scaffold28118_cov70-Phaeocystis_antarctica.AAC.4
MPSYHACTLRLVSFSPSASGPTRTLQRPVLSTNASTNPTIPLRSGRAPRPEMRTRWCRSSGTRTATNAALAAVALCVAAVIAASTPSAVDITLHGKT